MASTGNAGPGVVWRFHPLDTCKGCIRLQPASARGQLLASTRSRYARAASDSDCASQNTALCAPRDRALSPPFPAAAINRLGCLRSSGSCDSGKIALFAHVPTLLVHFQRRSDGLARVRRAGLRQPEHGHLADSSERESPRVKSVSALAAGAPRCPGTAPPTHLRPGSAASSLRAGLASPCTTSQAALSSALTRR